MAEKQHREGNKMKYPIATVICMRCSEVAKTTLEHKSITCPGCGESVQVREKGDKELIKVVNDKPVSEAVKTEAPEPVERKRGATKIAREYYASVYKKFKKGKLSRTDIINRVVELGVNKGTAGVQWSKFIREQN